MPNMLREVEMMRERFLRWSTTPRSRLFSAVVFLILLVLAIAIGDTLFALGLLSFLVAIGLLHAASEVATRSRTLAYLSTGFIVLGWLLVVTGLVINFL